MDSEVRLLIFSFCSHHLALCDFARYLTCVYFLKYKIGIIISTLYQSMQASWQVREMMHINCFVYCLAHITINVAIITNNNKIQWVFSIIISKYWKEKPFLDWFYYMNKIFRSYFKIPNYTFIFLIKLTGKLHFLNLKKLKFCSFSINEVHWLTKNLQLQVFFN